MFSINQPVDSVIKGVKSFSTDSVTLVSDEETPEELTREAIMAIALACNTCVTLDESIASLPGRKQGVIGKGRRNAGKFIRTYAQPRGQNSGSLAALLG